MLSKILWQNTSRRQLIGALIGSFIGTFLLLFALQIWFDVRYLSEGGEASKGEYVSINKRVSLLGTLGLKPSFSEADVANIKAQPFLKSIGNYTPNLFRVSASSKMLGFYTQLFFEAVPTNMLDVADSRFRWQEGDREIPIVISRDYLALYNFGFAMSQGLPQFTAGTIQQVTVDINISGKGKAMTLPGRIVGFSDRINSILVPDSFMQWANNNYGDEPASNPSRLLLGIENPYSAAFETFLDDNNYEVSSGKLIGGRMSVLLNSLVLALAVVGVIIVILSALVFVMNFQLMISKAASDIKLLLQLGYQHQALSKLLYQKMAMLFMLASVLALFALWLSRWSIGAFMNSQGLELPSGVHMWVWGAALVLIVTILGINTQSIKNNVKALF